jgi:tRNA-2-methylthio-N6-dimethylallyladenosine synthase
MGEQVPEAVKSARLSALQALLGRQALAFNESKAGLTVPVLFAEPGRKPGQLIGKTPWLQSVYADGKPRLIGRIVEARILSGHANSLAGEIVTGTWEAAA